MKFQKEENRSSNGRYQKGHIPWTKNRHRTKETKKKISEKNRGRLSKIKDMTLEEAYGKEKANKMRLRMSKSQTGKKHSALHNKHFSESMKGHKTSDETKEKIRESNKISSKIFWDNHPEIKKILSEKRKGNKHSESTKLKMSITAKKKGFGKWNKDRKYSEERKKQQSIRMKMEYKTGKRKAWNKNRKMTLEERQRESDMWKQYWDLRGRKHEKRSHHLNNSLKYIEWRKAVFERDNYTCQMCGERSKPGKLVYLEAHHRKSWVEYPKLRYDIDNGLTLCKECHKKITYKHVQES